MDIINSLLQNHEIQAEGCGGYEVVLLYGMNKSLKTYDIKIYGSTYPAGIMKGRQLWKITPILT